MPVLDPVLRKDREMTQLTIDLSESDDAMIRSIALDAVANGEYYGDVDYAYECEWRYFEDDLAYQN
jgi:hypothetical protein